MDPVDLSTFTTDGLEDTAPVAITVADLKKLQEQGATAEALQTKAAEYEDRYDRIAPLALAGLELARQDVTPEEVKQHLSVLIDADGSYTDEQKQMMLDNIGAEKQDTPSGGTDDPTETKSPKETPMTEDERNEMAALRAQVEQLQEQTKNTSGVAGHANAQILRDRLNKRIQAFISDKNFAGGVVKSRSDRYGDDVDKRSTFESTVAKQLETATLTLLRSEIKAGRSPTEINIEALVEAAAEDVGGTLQTVIGEDLIGPLTETVAGESDYLNAIEDLDEVKDVTRDEIRTAHSQDAMNELVDRQTNAGLSTLLKAAQSAEQQTNDTEAI